MTPATAAVAAGCIALGAGTGVLVYRLLAWVLHTQDDREVAW